MGIKEAYVGAVLKAGSKKIKRLVPKGELILEQDWKDGRGSPLTPIPPLTKEAQEELEMCSINPPFSYSRVFYDSETAEHIYAAIEPPLMDKQLDLLRLIKDSLGRTLEYELDKMGNKDKEEYLKRSIESFLKTRSLRLNPQAKEKIIYYIVRDYVGYGPIDVLMSDP